jgi:hypothetical protein
VLVAAHSLLTPDSFGGQAPGPSFVFRSSVTHS